MRFSRFFLAFSLFFLAISSKTLFERLYPLPSGFEILWEIDGTILQDLRSAKNSNPLGRPLHGLLTNECVLAREAALSLRKVQREVQKLANFAKIPLTLKVFECYRPKSADEQLFYRVLQGKLARKREFSPVFEEIQLVSRGLLGKTSEYNTGFSVAVTLSTNLLEIPMESATFDCFSHSGVDMGTNFGCFHEKSFRNCSLLTGLQRANRKLLQILMENHGFRPSSKESWWQFTWISPETPASHDFPVKVWRKREFEAGFCPVKARKPAVSLENGINLLKSLVEALF